MKTETITAATPSLDEVAQATATRFGAGLFAPKNASELGQLAADWYDSELLPESYYPPLQTEKRPRGFPHAARWEKSWRRRGITRATIVMRYGASLGVLPEQAIRNIYIVEGQPSPSAQLMLALCIAGGHLRRDDFEIESTATSCTIKLFPRRAKPEIVTAEITEFRHLVDKLVWRQYPRDMLFARCISRMVRRYFPDVFAGVYCAEERLDASPSDAADPRIEDILRAVDMPPEAAPPVADPEPDPVIAPTSLAEQDNLVDELTKLIAALPADAAPDDPRRAEIEAKGALVQGARRNALAAAYAAKKAPSRG